MRNTLLTAFAIVLSSALALGQNNCSGKPASGTCPAPASPVQLWCAGNNGASTCPGGTSWVGFDTTSPAAGSWTLQFEGIDAHSIQAIGHIPGAQPDPVGGVGPTDESGTGQYLQFAANYVQAFDRATGNGIFSNQPNSTAAPQPITTIFAPGGSSYCVNPSLDGFASYDRIDQVFVVGNIFKTPSSYNFCIGVSAASGSVPANNLEGTGGQSKWNVYAYNISPAIPLNLSGTTYFPDYVRFGNWSNGYYIAWDLEDIAHNFNIVGFEVCKLDKADMVAGLSTTAPQCYTYIPSYVVGAAGTDKSLIHTLLPADFEGENAIPANTAGEYFLAQVNPSNPGTNISCSQSPCTSNQFAFWTWSGFTSGAAPTMLLLKFHSFTPGCYSPKSPYNTYCVFQPWGGVIDSIGDRLMSRLAYRYVTSGTPSEYLAVAHTVQEVASTRRTGVRYYKIRAGKTPAIAFIGDIQDTTNFFFASAPSVAMDKLGDLGITYTLTGNTGHGAFLSYDPSPYFVTIGPTGTQGTPVAVLANSGSSGQDETDQYWGEYVSVSSDPDNDMTFWSVNEYLNGNQLSNCSYKANVGSGCTWASRVYACQVGAGC